jgi:hypothetical protein
VPPLQCEGSALQVSRSILTPMMRSHALPLRSAVVAGAGAALVATRVGSTVATSSNSSECDAPARTQDRHRRPRVGSNTELVAFVLWREGCRVQHNMHDQSRGNCVGHGRMYLSDQMQTHLLVYWRDINELTPPDELPRGSVILMSSGVDAFQRAFKCRSG